MEIPVTTTLPDTPTPGPRPRGRSRWLLAPLRAVRRRPLRALGLTAGAVLLLAGVGVGGLLLWFDQNLRAASREVERGHNAAATRHLRLCQWVRPEHRGVLLLGARVARRSGAWGEAGELLDKYSVRYGDDEPLVFERLLLRASTGDLEAAGGLLAERIGRGGADASLAREAVVAGLQYRFRWADATRVLDDWAAAAPDDTFALMLRGKLQEQRGQTSESLLTFRRVLELDADHDEARMRLTALLLTMRQGEEALTHAEYLRRRLPSNAEAWMQWVRAMGLQGRTAEARAALDEYLRAHPDHPGALAERGRYAAQDGDDAQAEKYFHRAVLFDPGNYALRHQYSLSLARNGKQAQAEKERAALRSLEVDNERINELVSGKLQASPNNPAIHHEIGLIALRSGQPPEALRWFKSALQVDPDHLPTHQTLAVFYTEIGNPPLAARHRAMAQKLSRTKAP